ncbi:tRNA 2-selenouridine(34) synthase MnmH [Porticoccaceae bacterium]|jgi:tRNA 2-selenouridine synthase|nr:tRNA 2-selenouridine(34) synthase MnmH [Porticoccaceae bacterium]MDB9843536.1 tRNA 2-selenouridine(34) synthase MnmH [Porticoccaceae bacterium]MDC1476731.1 tRNA 2-selenouridine(34) synthase MnmH [Porticoccaceae bacterium]CAI8382050.1 MAG: tRNA 2-selenouridine synthase [SAR92 bacterium MED-G29]|tara:strand:- start:1451 stop:2542 length:1092 start_codon:yes stop_codon:yes gene_type:complete
MSLPTINHYRELLLNDTPMIDVRAPIEFITGALPSSANLPLMSDDERHQVGIRYKNNGQQSAIELGNSLVVGDVKDQRVQAWIDFVAANPSAVLYCARGGLRSELSCGWLADAGIHCPKVEGGYKALRGYLYQYLIDYSANNSFTILSGMTGTGKTEIIQQLDNAVDLEGAANHKGSSFGRPLDGQPVQINFENRFTLDILKIEAAMPDTRIVLEDESRNIGARHLPHYFSDHMSRSHFVVIEMDFEERLERLWQEYVVERYLKTMAFYGATGEEEFASYLRESLLRVQKRLGGQRTKELLASMDSAIAIQHQDNFASHRDWLTGLTRDYYDPMYTYQLEKKKELVVFRGNREAVIDWLRAAG